MPKKLLSIPNPPQWEILKEKAILLSENYHLTKKILCRSRYYLIEDKATGINGDMSLKRHKDPIQLPPQISPQGPLYEMDGFYPRLNDSPKKDPSKKGLSATFLFAAIKDFMTHDARDQECLRVVVSSVGPVANTFYESLKGIDVLKIPDTKDRYLLVVHKHQLAELPDLEFTEPAE